MMIDVKTLLESADDDLEFAEDLLNLFSEQVLEEMDALADACKGDAAQVASIAHKLVGSAAACGFVGFSTELRSVELRCLQGMPNDIEQRIGHLKGLFEEGRVGMRTFLAGSES
ncbi:Hpt domain-containing protein [Pontiellaceae bacterium B1224]|nr:Hpt domain-containing protein [Pontiellaceae bacterium B1224]